jgi:hypothetical protein
MLKVLSIILLPFLIAGCASEQSNKNSYSPYHKLLLDDPEAQVWADSRFELVSDGEGSSGKHWLYTDYQGQQDQEFIFVWVASEVPSKWPPAEQPTFVEVDSPIGKVYQVHGGVELSAFGIPGIGEAKGFQSPACGWARIWVHRSESGRFLNMIYIEGQFDKSYE